MAEEIEFFETKKIVCTGLNSRDGDAPEEYTILLQNANGPCPLVALVNTLILSDQKIQQKDGSVLSLAGFTSGKERISVNGILEQLGELLIQKMQNGYEHEGTSSGDAEQEAGGDVNADNALGLLPKLVTGLNINLRFNGTFEDTPEMSLFRIYDVDIVHGWVVDPDDLEYHMISKVNSYDEAQSVILQASQDDTLEGEERIELQAKAAAVKHFMETNATQLTSYGLGQLRALLTPDSPAVFFRNDHFATLISRNNCLYTLVADRGYKDESTVVWHSVNSASGNEDEFYDGQFRQYVAQAQSEQQLVDANANQTPKDENADYILARELQAAADSELAQELAQEQQQQQRNAAPAGRRSSARNGQPQNQDAQPRGDRRRAARNASGDKKKKCIIS